MSDRLRRQARIACGIALSALFAAVMPAACIFPDYTFDEPEPSGSGGGDPGGPGGGMGGESPATTSSGATGGGAGGSGQGGGGAGGVGGASSSSSSSGAGGMPGGEDCFNGSDDDSDGMTDCADPDCEPATTCVANVPFGWSGFAALFEGVPAQEPACPGVFPSPNPYKGNHSPIAGSPTCAACSCDPAAGQTCNPPLEMTVQNKACGMQPNFFGDFTQPAGWTGACYGVSGFFGGDTTCNGPCNVSITAPAPTVSGGSCAAQGGQANVPPLSWAILGKACGDSPLGGGCGAGKVCQPKPPLPFVSGVCIYKSGDQACPGDPYTQKHVFYGGVNDTRGCTACSCGGVSGGSCAMDITVYSDMQNNTCNTPAVTFPAGGCGNLVGNPTVYSRKATVTQQPSGGTCPASGGQPMGAATPSDPTTFCCIQ